jgi:hypothetical protein
VISTFTKPLEGKLMFREVKTWLQMFCTKYETIAHAQEATRQLNMFVGSAIFVDTCGRHASDAILAWLANSFFVHAESLFFAYRKHLRCFDEYVNSVVEQQHSAVKTVRQTTTFEIRLCITYALPFSLSKTNTGTKATYSLDTSVRCMNFKADMKVMYSSLFLTSCVTLQFSTTFLG